MYEHQLVSILQSVQAAFMAEEWVDHTLDQARQVEGKLIATKKARAEVDKKFKETLSQLTEVEKAQKNVEVALNNFEKQAAESLKAQRKVENKLALNVVELKQLQKQLQAKDVKKAKAEQAAYDVGMTKMAESLTVQLKDVARAFCLEVQGQALSAAGVNTELELRALDKIYYSPALCLAPSPSQPTSNPSLAPISSLTQPATTPSTTPAKDKEKENVVDVETEETTEVAQLKRKKKEKEQEKKGGKEKEAPTQRRPRLRN